MILKYQLYFGIWKIWKKIKVVIKIKVFKCLLLALLCMAKLKRRHLKYLGSFLPHQPMVALWQHYGSTGSTGSTDNTMELFFHAHVWKGLLNNHRHLSKYIDCLMACTTCLVCFINTVNSRIKKLKKEALEAWR